MIPSQLATNSLNLRPFSRDDAAAVFAYWQSDAGWERFNASVPKNYTLEDATAFVEMMCTRNRESAPHWALVYQETVIGVVSLSFEQDHRIAVLGYGVHGALRGKGLSGEAALAVIGEAFSCCPQLQKIRSHTDAENTPSMRVLEKLGFLREGVLRRNQFVKGRLVDEAIYGLLREDWKTG